MLYATIEPTSQGNEPKKKKNCLQTSSWYTKLQFLGKFPHVAIKVVLYYSNLSVRYYPHMYKVSLFYNILNKVSYDRKELYNALFESDTSPVFFFLISLFFLFKQASRKKLGLIYSSFFSVFDEIKRLNSIQAYLEMQRHHTYECGFCIKYYMKQN